jgi:hypothetical protein
VRGEKSKKKRKKKGKKKEKRAIEGSRKTELLCFVRDEVPDTSDGAFGTRSSQTGEY